MDEHSLCGAVSGRFNRGTRSIGCELGSTFSFASLRLEME